MKSCRRIATARASLRFKCCPGPRLQDLGSFTEESHSWSPHSSPGPFPLTDPTGVPHIRGASTVTDDSRCISVTS